MMLRGGVLVVGAAGASHNSIAATAVKPDPGAQGLCEGTGSLGPKPA